MRTSLILIVIISIFQNTINAQNRVLIAERMVDETEEYYGSYYQIQNPEKLTPIEQKMESANFCEISGGYILVPNYATEAFEDGTTPIEEVSLDRISLLLRNDIIGYYNLQDRYNTPLKVKRFKNSEKYSEFEENFAVERKNFLDGIYYAVTEVESEYDLNKGTFTIALPFNGYDNRVSLKTRNDNFKYGSYITNCIDEDTAYRIESNPCILVVFIKFTGETTGFDIKECVCNPIKAYIADKKSGEIYYECIHQKESEGIATITPSSPPQPKKEIESDKDKVYNVVEQMPKFPGGDVALFKFISKNLVYPKKAIKENAEGRVIVKFVVSKDGSLKNISILRGCSPELNQEAMRIFQLPTMPKWTPGTRNGEPVNVTFSFPITFKLQ